MAGRIFVGLAAPPGPAGGPGGVNRAVADAVLESFEPAADPDGADLQIHALPGRLPEGTGRVFVDHGAFADASFWACVAPALTGSDAILVGSTVCQRLAEAMIESDGPEIHLVPFGIDTRHFSPPNDRRQARMVATRALAVPDDGPWLLVVGGFTSRKNHHLAVRCLAIIHRSCPAARLLIAGGVANRPSSASYRQTVEDLARETGVLHRTHFLGVVSREAMRSLMQASDLLLHLSTCRLENFGLAVAEALACGLPVLASDWGGFRDLVRDGENGFLARTWLSARGPRVDWMTLAGRALRLLQDSTLAAGLWRAARASAEPWLSLPAFRQRVVAALRSLLDRRPRQPRGLRLTPAAEELRFRTLNLHATRPEVRGTSDEYRLLLPLDRGRHYRLLSGAAASCIEPPRVTPASRLYQAVSWRGSPGGIIVTDPPWPGELELGEFGKRLLRRCDGVRPIADLVEEDCGGEPREPMLAEAQRLVDEGVLAPAD